MMGKFLCMIGLVCDLVHKDIPKKNSSTGELEVERLLVCKHCGKEADCGRCA